MRVLFRRGSAPGLVQCNLAASRQGRGRYAFLPRFSSSLAIIVLIAVAVPMCAPAVQAADMSEKQPTVPEPSSYRMDDYRAPVPASIKGAKTITADEARALWLKGDAAFVDVYPHPPKPANLPTGTIWRDPTHFSIENATWLANVGFGVLSKDTEAYFKSHLEALTGGDKAKPVVFFCLRNCWMSWNAAKRAVSYGYSDVMWFSEGFDAWQEIGQPIAQLKPQP
jgi:PQQ-dependent catabolism-associated CXXCW motif protein